MRNPLTKTAFADWAEKQAGEYQYTSLTGCACAQYASSLGLTNQWLGPDSTWSDFWNTADIIAARRPRTFSALAARLRA